ncbi:MAG: isoamylase early set domain-containing protein [Syntrophaceae bacterium]
MARKDEVKKTGGKAAEVSKPGKTAKTRADQAKAPAKIQKKGTAQKKPARTRAKAKTTVRLEAPQAAKVFIVGSFNEWDPMANPLERDEEGTWSCTLSVEPGEHEYRFVVDDVWWDDPANALRRWNEFGTQNCILIIEE